MDVFDSIKVENFGIKMSRGRSLKNSQAIIDKYRRSFSILEDAMNIFRNSNDWECSFIADKALRDSYRELDN